MRKQEKKIAFLEDQERKRLEEPQADEEAVENVRFSARSVAAQRKRLDLSAADYAKLVGVSALTIYNWEKRQDPPRQGQLAALVAIRGIGKREAQKRLELLGKKGRATSEASKRMLVYLRAPVVLAHPNRIYYDVSLPARTGTVYQPSPIYWLALHQMPLSVIR